MLNPITIAPQEAASIAQAVERRAHCPSYHISHNNDGDVILHVHGEVTVWSIDHVRRFVRDIHLAAGDAQRLRERLAG